MMRLTNLPGRIRGHLGRRYEGMRRNLMSRSGWFTRRSRWPIPGSEPFRQAMLHLGRYDGLGDVLLCTPAIRTLKQLNPACRVVFSTRFPSLVDGLPYFDEVREWSNVTEPPPNLIEFRYEEWIPPQRHIARIFGDQIGVAVRDVQPDCVVEPGRKDEAIDRLKDFPRPWIILNRRASGWSPNKNWPDDRWDDLIDRLVDWASVVEIGSGESPTQSHRDDRYVSLIGQLSLAQFVGLIAVADLNVGPVSGPVHVAAAFDVPSVVVIGGYEHPVNTHYPGNTELYSAIECAPCWLREPCPFDKKCLNLITPVQVEAALKALAARNRRRARPRVPLVGGTNI